MQWRISGGLEFLIMMGRWRWLKHHNQGGKRGGVIYIYIIFSARETTARTVSSIIILYDKKYTLKYIIPIVYVILMHQFSLKIA